jgi:hypothetical protein
MSKKSAAIQAGLRFIVATQDTTNGTWYEEPFETILVLDLLADIAPEMFTGLSQRPLEWLASLQKDDGRVIGIRYTGMAASLFMKATRITKKSYKEAGERSLECIRQELAEKPIWSTASWSNYYPLRALLDRSNDSDQAFIQKAIDWYLAAQGDDGRWLQVSQIHDTAMAILVLSTTLTVPLVDISDPRIGILNASKENGTIRVSFHGPGSGAITPAEKMKISDEVRADLSQNQQLLISALGSVRGSPRVKLPEKPPETMASELERAGKYAYGHLIPARIQMLLENCSADHLQLDIDERLIDLPWELIHDGTDYLCVRYAVGRRLLSDQAFAPPQRYPKSANETRVLVVADPTGDLPAAKQEGQLIAQLLRERCGMQVDGPTSKLTKKDFLLSLRDYEIIHFAGHASHDPSSPDESCLVLSDGEIQAFEIARFIASRSPVVVFLNACWSAEELRDPESYSPMIRGLGRTFLFSGVNAFLGYLVPVPDASATRFALEFYSALAQGQTIGESVRLARILSRATDDIRDLTWSAVLLYGDPTRRAVESAQFESV